MANNYFVNTASDQVREQYARENNKGNGISVGNDDQAIEDAIRAEGWTVDESFADSLATAHDANGNRYIVGGDGSRRNAWAVSAE